MSSAIEETTTCTVIGGGPAGMVLSLLLARARVKVTMLEKHADFLRDFRGDTVHPTTMRLLDDLGLYEKFAALPQGKIRSSTLDMPDGDSVTVGDFRRLHRKALIACVFRAAEWRHKEVELAAHQLLQHLDEVAA